MRRSLSQSARVRTNQNTYYPAWQKLATAAAVGESTQPHVDAYGVRWKSYIRRLPGIHRRFAYVFPSDAMHDLVEGPLSASLSSLLHHALSEGVVTITALNERIAAARVNWLWRDGTLYIAPINADELRESKLNFSSGTHARCCSIVAYIYIPIIVSDTSFCVRICSWRNHMSGILHWLFVAGVDENSGSAV